MAVISDFIGKTELKLSELVNIAQGKALDIEGGLPPKVAGLGLQLKEGDVLTFINEPVLRNIDGQGLIDEKGLWRPGSYWTAKVRVTSKDGDVLADGYSLPLAALWARGKEYPSIEKTVIPSGMTTPVPNRFGRELLTAQGLSTSPFSSRLQLLENETLKVAYLFREIGGLRGGIRITKAFAAFNLKFASKEAKERVRAAEGRQWGSKESDWRQTPIIFCEVASRGQDFAEESTPTAATGPNPETTTPRA